MMMMMLPRNKFLGISILLSFEHLNKMRVTLTSFLDVIFLAMLTHKQCTGE